MNSGFRGFPRIEVRISDNTIVPMVIANKIKIVFLVIRLKPRYSAIVALLRVLIMIRIRPTQTIADVKVDSEISNPS